MFNKEDRRIFEPFSIAGKANTLDRIISDSLDDSFEATLCNLWGLFYNDSIHNMLRNNINLNVNPEWFL